jgi:hypothetical protein
VIWRDRILALDPCADAREWLESLPDEITPEQAWCECERGDWMLWLAGRLNVERVAIVRTACAVARSVLHLVPPGEDRPRAGDRGRRGVVRRPQPCEGGGGGGGGVGVPTTAVMTCPTCDVKT